jgi:hypothetical protein
MNTQNAIQMAAVMKQMKREAEKLKLGQLILGSAISGDEEPIFIIAQMGTKSAVLIAMPASYVEATVVLMREF